MEGSKLAVNNQHVCVSIWNVTVRHRQRITKLYRHELVPVQLAFVWLVVMAQVGIMRMEDNLLVYVVDDEKIVLSRLRKILVKIGFVVRTFSDPFVALASMEEQMPHIVITDVKMPGMDGIELFRRIKAQSMDTEVIVATGYSSMDTAIDVTKEGAFYYLVKPFKLEKLKLIVNKAAGKVRMALENSRLRGQIEERRRFHEIVGESEAIRSIFATINKVAKVDCSVIIQGESGTGKELIARALHHESHRSKGPFIPFNCASFTEELMANELFGHEKGAFTGADEMKPGLLELADKGTLFLDEVADMPMAMQVKLLRVLQERVFLRVGGVKEVKINVRVLVATNKDIKAMVENGQFRNDLFYRLNVVFISVPPLPERKEDIPLLVFHFIKKYNALFKKKVKGAYPDFLKMLMGYSFPGNVRELENIVERAVALTDGNELTVRELPSDFNVLSITSLPAKGVLSLKDYEKDYILTVYSYTGHNQQHTAKLLGISRTTLWRKLKDFGLDEAEVK